MATPAGFEPATFSLEGSRCLHDIKANSDIWVRFGPLSEIRNFRLSERDRSAPVARARRRPNLKMIWAMSATDHRPLVRDPARDREAVRRFLQPHGDLTPYRKDGRLYCGCAQKRQKAGAALRVQS